MNRSIPNMALCIEQDGSSPAFNRLARMLLPALLAAAMVCHGLPAFAGPQIEIGFEADAADSQKLVHAKAVFDAPQALVYRVFNRITG